MSSNFIFFIKTYFTPFKSEILQFLHICVINKIYGIFLHYNCKKSWTPANIKIFIFTMKLQLNNRGKSGYFIIKFREFYLKILVSECDKECILSTHPINVKIHHCIVTNFSDSRILWHSLKLSQKKSCILFKSPKISLRFSQKISFFLIYEDHSPQKKIVKQQIKLCMYYNFCLFNIYIIWITFFGGCRL